MENTKEIRLEDCTELFNHLAVRPLRYVRGKDGYGWLCDKAVDPDCDLRAQGCWRCDEMAFPTGGR